MDSVVYNQHSFLVGKPCKVCDSEVPTTLKSKRESMRFPGALPDHCGWSRLVQLTVESLPLLPGSGTEYQPLCLSISAYPYLDLKWGVSQPPGSSKVCD